MYNTFLLLLLLLSPAVGSSISLLYFNDAHEIAPVHDIHGERGGVARLKTLVDKVRESNPECLVIFGGDLAGGTLFGSMFHGFPLVEAFNQIPIDIANFGQHDFDFGPAVTRRLVDASEFEWLSSNLREADGRSFHNVPTVLKKTVKGLNIGFLGLTDAMQSTTPGPIQQNDLMQSCAQVLPQLKNMDVIVAITQTDAATNTALLKRFPNIHVILSEEQSETQTRVEFWGDRPIVSPCGNIGSMARIDIAKTCYGIRCSVSSLPVDATVLPDPDLLLLEENYQHKLQIELNTVVGQATAPLDAGIGTDFRCRWGETALGNLITDAFRDYYAADIAVINGGGIRANIAQGVIRLYDIFSVLPFHNNICLIRISGTQLNKLLEHGVSAVESSGGRFLQISGARYTYDWQKPIGERIVKSSHRGKPIHQDSSYTLALPDFRLHGGDGFNELIRSDVVVSPDSAPKDTDVLIDFIKKQSPIRAGEEGRITILGKD